MAGAVENLRGCFCAHMQQRGKNGRKDNIRGPTRGEKRKAEDDLATLRAAAKHAGPGAAWGAMDAESRRLKERADFEARVSACASALPVRPPSLCSEDSDAPDIEDQEPGDSQEYYNDFDELWQDIDEEGRLPSYYQPPPLLLMPDPKDAVEATALLSKFRPVRNTKEDLEKLLDARADPNFIARNGDISPLMRVMTYADKDDVGPMRALLLKAGATQNDEAKERWESRRSTDACEEAWLRNFHRDPALVPYDCL
jgi:hypothetical protein